MPAKLIEIDEARRLVLERARPLGAEPVPLADALGRVLAAAGRATEAVPPFDSSAMDGFAVRAADTAGATSSSPVALPVVDESRAGSPAARALGAGEAIAISTGAMLPEGADAVVRVEDTAPRDGRVEVLTEVDLARDVRRAGDDIAPGTEVIAAGTTIGPAELGVLAALGIAEPSCARRPRVAVVTTGDELLRPDEPSRPGGIRNTNGYAVPALARLAGAVAEDAVVVGDDAAATREAIARALEADVAVASGGVSVGRHDHVRPALAELGVEQVFWGVSLRPGKPTWFGTSPSGGLVFGLPGNPVSAMVTFTLFAAPAVRAMLGAEPRRPRTTAVLDRPYEKQPGRAHVVRCRLEARDDGWHVRPTGPQDSHVLTSMLGAEALAFFGSESEGAQAGERVEIELLPSGPLASTR